MREHAWSRPQGPGGPARAYRYRLALRRPYATASAATGAGCGWMVWPRRAVGLVGRVRAREGLASKAWAWFSGSPLC